MGSTAENLLLWEQRIKERVQNGITIEEWCKKNGVSKYQYFYWKRRLCKKQNSQEETTFADITPILSTAGTARQNTVPTPDFQVFVNNIRVSVPVDFNPAALTGLMKVLQEL